MAWLKLDWDNITEATMVARVVTMFDNLRMMPKVYKTGHGYHIYIWVFLTRNFEKNEVELIKLRHQYWDDTMRINLDIDRMKRGQPHDVLFHEKEGFMREFIEPSALLNIIESYTVR